MSEYRAAYLGDTVLTKPEHAGLSDAELMSEARRELDRVDPEHAEDGDGRALAPRDAVRIGTWTA